MRIYSIAAVLGQDEVNTNQRTRCVDVCSRVMFQVDALEREALDVLALIRSWRNTLSPINRVPPEVLTLIPDFWDGDSREEAVITLTHVCRTWREMFTSRSSLWTNFDCEDVEKTRVYLERSKSSPIKVGLDREYGLLLHDPFLQVVPRAVGRLERLFVRTTPDDLQDITSYLSDPAPLIESLEIHGSTDEPEVNPVLTTTLFGGDLSSLRDLSLYSVSTGLPWRNMANLTTFALGYVLSPRVTIGQLLDFFESAPRLLNIELTFATPTDGIQNGRLVPLTCLRRLHICEFLSSSLLLDHLLIPAGAKMATYISLPGPRFEDHFPRSLDNLKNLPDFTKICLHFQSHLTSVKLAGPNGRICMAATHPRHEVTRLVPQSLALLDTSKTNWLEIIKGDPLSQDLHRAFLPIENLQSLTLSLCKNVHLLILALCPGPNSTDPIPCPKLERLVFRTEEQFDLKIMVEVAAARSLGGAPLRSVKIIYCGEVVPMVGAVELQDHVLDVETRFEVIDKNYGSGNNIPEDSDEDSDRDSDEDSDED